MCRDMEGPGGEADEVGGEDSLSNEFFVPKCDADVARIQAGKACWDDESSDAGKGRIKGGRKGGGGMIVRKVRGFQMQVHASHRGMFRGTAILRKPILPP